MVCWVDYPHFYQEKKKTWMVVDRKFRNVLCIRVVFLLMIMIFWFDSISILMMIQIMVMDGDDDD